MDRRSLVRRGVRVGLLAGAAAVTWQLQRRADRRRVTADPESVELDRPLGGRAIGVTSADGTRLHAEVFGPDGAPTIVLVHGWMGALEYWHYQIRDLAGEFRVVAYDQRGHGRSEMPGSAGYTPGALADDLHAVLSATVPSGERCVLAGHSMGGMTVVAWAGRHSDGVRRAVAAAALIDTGTSDLGPALPGVPPRVDKPLRAWLTTHVAGAPLPLPRTSTPLSRRLIRFNAYGPGAGPAVVAFGERMILGTPAGVRAGFGRFFAELDLDPSVPKLDVPTAVVVGALDRLTPPRLARRLCAELPQCVQLLELPDVAHMSPLEAPERVTRVLRELARRYLVEAPAAADVAAAQPAVQSG